MATHEAEFQLIQEHVDSYERGRWDELETVNQLVWSISKRYSLLADATEGKDDRLICRSIVVALAEVLVGLEQRKGIGGKVMPP